MPTLKVALIHIGRTALIFSRRLSVHSGARVRACGVRALCAPPRDDDAPQSALVLPMKLVSTPHCYPPLRHRETDVSIMFAVGGGQSVWGGAGSQVSGWPWTPSSMRSITPPPATAERGERLSSGLRVALPLMAY